MCIRQHVICLMVILFILVSCGGNNSSHRFAVSTSEKGADLRVNSGGPKYETPLYDIDETLSLGGEEPEPTLFEPRSFLVDDDGNLYFTDDDRIKKFDSTGKFRRFISRRGNGPGEVSYPSLERFLGDTLVVSRYRHSGSLRKWDLFYKDGTYIKRLNVPRLSEPLVDDGYNWIDSYLGSSTVLFVSSKTWAEGETNLANAAWGLADISGTVIDSLDLSFKSVRQSIIKHYEDYYTSVFLPFSLGYGEVYYRDNLYYLMPEGREIHMFNKKRHQIEDCKI